jgi:hypothetical protein
LWRPRVNQWHPHGLALKKRNVRQIAEQHPVGPVSTFTVRSSHGTPIEELTMMMKTKLLGAGAALLLSAGAALAVPATAQTDLNVRSGPGPQYPVVGSIRGGETVDVGSCTGSWCQVSSRGGSGFASRSYLAMGGAVGPGPAVAAVPYGYDDDYYDDGAYYGYGYGPSVGFYAGSRGWGGGGWRGHRGNWQGHAGNWQGRGNWQGGRVSGGTWQGRSGGAPAATGGGQAQRGFAGPPANWARSGSGSGGAASAAPQAATAAPTGGAAQSGFAGSIVRGGR